jgi:acetyltransferase-like isoleucine patch superfamily enzyme
MRYLNSIFRFYNQRLLRRYMMGTASFKSCGILRLRVYGTLVFEGDITVNSSARCNPVGKLNRTFIRVDKKASLVIGHNCRISNTTIICQQNISIGKNVMIGGGTEIYDTDFHSLKAEERIRDEVKGKKASVTIGDNVFIGTNTMVLKGSAIGDNVVIGANSVVSGILESNSVYVGNPLVKIR